MGNTRMEELLTPENREKLLAELKALEAKDPYIEVLARVPDAFAILGLLQLAASHPGVTGGKRRIAEYFGRQLQKAFADCPTVSAIAEAGWGDLHGIWAHLDRGRGDA